MGRRKVVYQDGVYQVLKPREDGTDRFNRYGRRKSLKAIVYLMNNDTCDLEISGKVREDIKKYLNKKKLGRKNQLGGRNLTKVI